MPTSARSKNAVSTVRRDVGIAPYGILPYPFVGGGVPDAPPNLSLSPRHNTAIAPSYEGAGRTPQREGDQTVQSQIFQKMPTP